jgi:hypothetical protein
MLFCRQIIHDVHVEREILKNRRRRCGKSVNPLLPIDKLWQIRTYSTMDVLQHFQLNGYPFWIGLDTRFLYFSDQVKEALEKCEYMARDRIGTIYIYGPI